MELYVLIFSGATLFISFMVLLISLFKKSGKSDNTGIVDEIRKSKNESEISLQNIIKNQIELISSTQKAGFDTQSKNISESLTQINEKFHSFSLQNEQKLEQIRTTLQNRIEALTEENSKKLDEMRNTVDEKLQKTLEERITHSFSLVNERLEQVYKSLGEMQNIASDVGDLKHVLQNVKSRGILGEIQLSAILEDILTPDQYEENFATKKGSANRVEFAIKLPGGGDGCIYLPVDSKFPLDAYQKLVDAADAADLNEIEVSKKEMISRIKTFAKSISEKYIDTPNTTDFAVMFLPFEGLYAEVIRLGLMEYLQTEYRVIIAGPTTMAALLNSLRMGFKTLAIQKHSGEVWQVLGEVKREFEKFGKVLENTQNKLNQANDELENLVGVRTRSIQKKLNSVTVLNELQKPFEISAEAESTED